MANIKTLTVGGVTYDLTDAAAQENKVDKVTGKQLSTNDFTNAQKTALDNIKAVITDVWVGAEENLPENRDSTTLYLVTE